MNVVNLTVAEKYVARVDAALKAAGLTVLETRLPAEKLGRPDHTIFTVIEGAPAPDVPRVIAHDGPRLPFPRRTVEL